MYDYSGKKIDKAKFDSSNKKNNFVQLTIKTYI